MKVVLSADARADLKEIAAYIAQDSRRRADSFVRELQAKARGLADAPQGYPLVPRYESSGIRRRPVGNYLIFYVVGPDRILVVNILHSARDHAKILFPGSEG